MDPTCLRTRARRVDPYSLTFVTQSHNFLSMTPESKLYLVSLTNNFCCFLVKIFEHLFLFLFLFFPFFKKILFKFFFFWHHSKSKFYCWFWTYFFFSNYLIYIYIYKYIYFYNSVTNNNFLKKKITNNNWESEI